jgi:hypothetical protein
VNVLMKMLCIQLLCIATIAQAKVSILRTENETVYTFQIEGVEFSRSRVMGNDFLRAHLRGVGDEFAAIKYEVGHPELPVIRFIVEGDVEVEVTDTVKTGSLKSKLRLKPSQRSWSKSSEYPPLFSMDSKAYESDGFVENLPYVIDEAGSYRGRKRRMVTLNAFEYNPVQGVYRLRENYKVFVRHPNKTSPGLPTLALIVGEKFASSPSLKRLQRIKQSQGFIVRSIVIGKDLQNSAEEIRQELRSLYLSEENLQFALIIGDITDVTSQPSENIHGVTDHYYRSVDTHEYRSDINSPDIGVGRISVSSLEELDVVVNKIERYVLGNFMDNLVVGTNSWLRYPAFIATHDRYQVAEATHNKVIGDFFEPRGYSRIFPDQEGRGGDKLYPISLGATRRQIVDILSQGRFIINFSGHGSYTGWEDVSAQDVLSFSHPQALPWVLSNSCITGDFRREPVFAETWLRHPSGAINFWGSMDSTYWDEDDILEKALYKEVFDKNVLTFDLAYQGALSEVWRYYGGLNRSKYYWETYVTFGDPSLELRTDYPQVIEVNGPDTIDRRDVSVSWTVSKDFKPVVGASVVLISELGDIFIRARTGEDGVVKFDLPHHAHEGASLRLYVQGSNYKMVEKNILIMGTKS